MEAFNTSYNCLPGDAPYSAELSSAHCLYASAATLLATPIFHFSSKLLQRHETGQRKIYWAARHIATGLSSLVQNFFHRSALKSGLGDQTYHTKGMYLSCEAGYNAYYKLMGQEQRTYLYVDDEILVTTVNHPKKCVKKKKERVKVDALVKCLMRKIQKEASYIDFDPSKGNLDSLTGGICLGMVQQCIIEFYKHYTGDKTFLESAQIAARRFQKGGPKTACAFQIIQYISSVNAERFEKENPLDESMSNLDRGLNQTYARDLTLFFAHGLGLAGRSIFDPSDPSFKLSSLKNGVYEVNNNWTVDRKNKPYQWDLKKIGHSTALFIEDERFLIFDPNVGLIKANDPDKYYDAIRGGETSFIVANQIGVKSNYASYQ